MVPFPPLRIHFLPPRLSLPAGAPTAVPIPLKPANAVEALALWNAPHVAVSLLVGARMAAGEPAAMLRETGTQQFVRRLAQTPTARLGAPAVGGVVVSD